MNIKKQATISSALSFRSLKAKRLTETRLDSSKETDRSETGGYPLSMESGSELYILVVLRRVDFI